MRESHSSPPSVVVGIDGSRAAVRAALWAVDEAVSRDIPLRLVYAIDSPDTSDADPQDAARKLATAELAVRSAFTAVESTEKPVKIEVEILQGRPTRALIDASRAAAMLCVGSIGVNHFTDGRVGSTAATLAASAHCPVVMIRGRGEATPSKPDWVVAVVDESVDSSVLQLGVQEARLHGAPLRVLTAWRSRFTDIHDFRAASEGNRQVRAHLDRSLACWRRRYPDLDLRSVAVHGSAVDYLAKHAADIQLVVVGRGDRSDVGDLLGPTGSAALHDTDCTVLVCDGHQRM
jgi:nucleotide-binding universal stress UspA family protein